MRGSKKEYTLSQFSVFHLVKTWAETAEVPFSSVVLSFKKHNIKSPSPGYGHKVSLKKGSSPIIV